MQQKKVLFEWIFFGFGGIAENIALPQPAVYNTVVTLELPRWCSWLHWSLLTPFIRGVVRKKKPKIRNIEKIICTSKSMGQFLSRRKCFFEQYFSGTWIFRIIYGKRKTLIFYMISKLTFFERFLFYSFGIERIIQVHRIRLQFTMNNFINTQRQIILYMPHYARAWSCQFLGLAAYSEKWKEYANHMSCLHRVQHAHVIRKPAPRLRYQLFWKLFDSILRVSSEALESHFFPFTFSLSCVPRKRVTCSALFISWTFGFLIIFFLILQLKLQLAKVKSKRTYIWFRNQKIKLDKKEWVGTVKKSEKPRLLCLFSEREPKKS